MAIWQNENGRWSLLSPVGFSDEAALHSMIEENPQLLPLAGSPGLVVLGREVPLGAGFADLLAVETSGRLVIVEIKLAKNAESRRAVVGQILSYASELQGMSLDELENGPLSKELQRRSATTITGAVEQDDQVGDFDREEFSSLVSDCLSSGRFRLVFVLDAAPRELVNIVAYLESVSEKLLIDLVTVAHYQVGEKRIIVPQRVEPERRVPQAAMPAPVPKRGRAVQGGDDFAARIENSPADQRPELRRLYDWAKQLEAQGLCRLHTYYGKTGRLTLLPWLLGENVGLATIWNDGGASLSLWRSVFERHAPHSTKVVESILGPERLGVGKVIRNPAKELLDAVAAAYREATELDPL